MSYFIESIFFKYGIAKSQLTMSGKIISWQIAFIFLIGLFAPNKLKKGRVKSSTRMSTFQRYFLTWKILLPGILFGQPKAFTVEYTNSLAWRFSGHSFRKIVTFYITAVEDGQSKAGMEVSGLSLCMLIWIVLTLFRTCLLIIV